MFIFFFLLHVGINQDESTRRDALRGLTGKGVIPGNSGIVPSDDPLGSLDHFLGPLIDAEYRAPCSTDEYVR